jgi:hypothetical protein
MKIHFPKKASTVMIRRGRPYLLLVLGILSLTSLGFLLINFSPESQPMIFNITIPLLPVFLFLLFTTLYFLGSFACKSKSHGFLIALFVLIYLLFRLNNLTHPFFFILLFALFLTLELFVSYRK